MDEKKLERATQIIPHNSFIKLMQLTMKHSWLEEESEALLELWNFCKFESEQELVFNLLMKFNYLTSTNIKKFGEQIADYITNDWKLRPDNTYIVAISDKIDADGSQMFIQSLKNKFMFDNWNEENFVNRIGDGLNLAKENCNIVLVDDFIGTGKTIARRVKWFNKKITDKKINNVSIHVVSLAALEMAIVKIKLLDVKYFSPLWLKRGISDFYKDEKKHLADKDMERLESELAEKYKGKFLPNFGYEKSEALFAIEGFNTPNNVFPVFWWPVLTNYKRRHTLLKRIM